MATSGLSRIASLKHCAASFRCPCPKTLRANIVVRFGVGRIEREGLLVGGNRLIQFALLQKHVAEQQMSIGTIRLESQSALGVFHRFRDPVQRDKRKANILVEICVPSFKAIASSDHVDGDFRAADLDGDETKMMEAPDMPWIGGRAPSDRGPSPRSSPCLELLKGFGGQDCGRTSARSDYRGSRRPVRAEPSDDAAFNSWANHLDWMIQDDSP